MDNYSVIKKNGKYALMKEGGKRALRLFKTEDEAFKYAEENDINLNRDDCSPIVDGEVLVTSDRIDLSKQQVFGCNDNCKYKKPSLLSRVIGFFKRTN